jgi:hypothetical protein
MAARFLEMGLESLSRDAIDSLEGPQTLPAR